MTYKISLNKIIVIVSIIVFNKTILASNFNKVITESIDYNYSKFDNNYTSSAIGIAFIKKRIAKSFWESLPNNYKQLLFSRNLSEQDILSAIESIVMVSSANIKLFSNSLSIKKTWHYNLIDLINNLEKYAENDLALSALNFNNAQDNKIIEQIFYMANQTKLNEKSKINYIKLSKKLLANIYFERAINRYIINSPLKSIASFNNALKIQPKEFFYRLFLAKALIDVGDYKKANKAIKTLLTENPNNSLVKYISGLYSYKQGRKTSALKTWQYLLKTELIYSSVLYDLANYFGEENNNAAKIIALKQAINIKSNANAYYDLANSEQNISNATKIEYLNSALNLQPNHTKSLKTLADIYEQQGQYNKAIANYGIFNSLIPDQAYINYKLGKLYLKINNKQMSLLYLNYAFLLDPNSDKIDDELIKFK